MKLKKMFFLCFIVVFVITASTMKTMDRFTLQGLRVTETEEIIIIKKTEISALLPATISIPSSSAVNQQESVRSKKRAYEPPKQVRMESYWSEETRPEQNRCAIVGCAGCGSSGVLWTAVIMQFVSPYFAIPAGACCILGCVGIKKGACIK